VQVTTLSRRQQRFESAWGRQINKANVKVAFLFGFFKYDSNPKVRQIGKIADLGVACKATGRA